jgi:O-antigen ligase
VIATPHSHSTGHRALQALWGLLVGVLVFGDYLALSLSRLLTGSAGNWMLFVGLLQPCILALALLLGTERRRLPWPTLLGYLGLCALGFAHALPVWLAGNELNEYASQKLGALFLLLLPAMLVGILLGHGERLPGTRALPWLVGPLLVMCLLALVTNPHLLTIEHFAEPPVFFGLLVMPTHQPLAFCLTKIALLALAVDLQAHDGRRPHLLRLGLVGALVGVVLLTGARSYALALVLALALMALLGGRRIGLLLVGAAIATLLFQQFGSELVQDRLDPTQALESRAFREREQAWQAAWLSFQNHPLVGVGPGRFAEAGGWHGRVYPHNLLLEVAAEFGIVGLLLLCLMFAAPVAQMVGGLLRREPPAMLGSFAAGLLLFCFIGTLAVGDLIRNHSLFFALGLAASALGRGQPAGMAMPGLAPNLAGNPA